MDPLGYGKVSFKDLNPQPDARIWIIWYLVVAREPGFVAMKSL